MPLSVSAFPTFVLPSNVQPDVKVGPLATLVIANKDNKQWLATRLKTLDCDICTENLDIPDILAIYEVYSGWEIPGDFKKICLFAGVRGNNDSVVQRIFASGADINSRDHLGRTPLHVAAEMDRESVLRTLLQKNPDVDAPLQSEDEDLDGSSPLHLAVDLGHEGAVAILLEVKASITCKNKVGKTPLDLSFCGSTKIFELLLAEQKDLLAQDKEGNSCLHKAANFGTAEILQSICARARKESCLGQLLELANSRGETALIVASQGDARLDRAIALIEAGANVNAVGQDGRTALHLAALNGTDQLVSCLLLKQPNVEAEDGDFMTPLHAAVCGCSVAVVDALLTAEAELEATDRFGNTPFLLAKLIYCRLFAQDEEAYFPQEPLGADVYLPPYSAYAICLKDGVQTAMASIKEIYGKLFSENSFDASLLKFGEAAKAGMHPQTFSPPQKEGEGDISWVDLKGELIPFMKEEKIPTPTSNGGTSPLFSWVKV